MDDLYTSFGSDGLSLAERARLGRLPDELSIYELSLLIAPDSLPERVVWQNILLTLAQEGKLAVAHGDPKGWSYWEGTVHAANPYPRCEAHVGWSKALSVAPTSTSPLSRQATFRKEGYPSNYQQATQVAGQASLIHRDALYECLASGVLRIPENSLLAQGWPDSSAPTFPAKQSTQQQQEQVLKAWLAERQRSEGLAPDQPLGMTVNAFWKILSKDYPIFTISWQAFQSFWQRQTVCPKRKRGRPKK